jgi:hypothetical protein
MSLLLAILNCTLLVGSACVHSLAVMAYVALGVVFHDRGLADTVPHNSKHVAWCHWAKYAVKRNLRCSQESKNITRSVNLAFRRFVVDSWT